MCADASSRLTLGFAVTQILRNALNIQRIESCEFIVSETVKDAILNIFLFQSCVLPKFGIEREVRVCDSCFDQYGPKEEEGGSPVHEKG